MSFKRDQWVTCQDDVLADLTFGKSYFALDVREDSVQVLNDKYEPVWYYNNRFTNVTAPRVESGPAVRDFQVIENEQVYCFDVDDTLVYRDDLELQAHDDINRVAVRDPYSGVTFFLRPHKRHISLLYQMFGRGRYVIVWSQSGVLWAKAVVEALALEAYVHMVITKPHGIVDDLPPQVWLSNRIYIEESK
ncbi:hypothetical protein UFOVP1351_41 [uncultured Caudovirales phage]|uniref:FCP1 homology domain-containing protein n=1 Tax=uncultured Caudovirales phage TaxID=2100421 RepID=A0A6J5RSQ2_9CAUD|nr:hypothetical protein UFOVP1351_41 [uncultured Caudovirales phage]